LIVNLDAASAVVRVGSRSLGTDAEFAFQEQVITCAVLAGLSAVPIPFFHSESRTPLCHA